MSEPELPHRGRSLLARGARAFVTRIVNRYRRLRAGRLIVAGRGLVVESGVSITATGPVSVGDDVRLMDHVRLWATATGRIAIGSRTFVGSHSWIVAAEEVVVGDDVLIAPFCYVQDTDHGFADPATPIASQPSQAGPIHIGHGAWLGAHVVVTRGVSIGDGAVIGANSVVTHDIPPLTVAAGAPARPIGRRGAVEPASPR